MLGDWNGRTTCNPVLVPATIRAVDHEDQPFPPLCPKDSGLRANPWPLDRQDGILAGLILNPQLDGLHGLPEREADLIRQRWAALQQADREQRVSLIQRVGQQMSARSEGLEPGLAQGLPPALIREIARLVDSRKSGSVDNPMGKPEEDRS